MKIINYEHVKNKSVILNYIVLDYFLLQELLIGINKLIILV